MRTERWSTEPVDILVRHALQMMKEAGVPMRERGWPVEAIVTAAEPHEDHFYEVILRIKIHSPGRIPKEARPGAD